MKLATFLELGRISNLPTVWSNVLSGAVLARGELRVAPLAVSALAGTLFYVGGMFLNDAFDAEIDAAERPERPIPSGRAARNEVLRWGFGLLGLGLALVAALSLARLAPSGATLPGAALGTVILIVLYDVWHKENPLSPLVMGLCRAGLYCIGALTVSPMLSEDVAIAAIALALYVVGLTYVARFETEAAVGRSWPTFFLIAPFALAALYPTAWTPSFETLWALALWFGAIGFVLWSIRLALLGGRARIVRAVVALIAGISLVDATLMASRAALVPSLFALGAFLLTSRLQRKIRGT